MRKAVFLLTAACLGLYEPGSTNEIVVRGAVTAHVWADGESGSAGPARDSFYTITLGEPGGNAVVVFTRAGGDPPPVGEYPVGGDALGGGGFSALVITGVPSHPTGVFQAQSGTLVITAASPERLAGRFELVAEGYLTRAPAQHGRMVAAEGGFITHPRDPAAAPSSRDN